MMQVSSVDSTIKDFYNGKSVFVTGGTGFVGKVLIEKLLYSCDSLKHIYMLMKPKHGKCIKDRLAEFVDSIVFQRIRDQNPAMLNKLIPIQGDIEEINLGLDNVSVKQIHQAVSVVFHVAADVHFNSCLSRAVRINTRGTGEVIKLSKGIKHLQAFVYVSTAYSQCHQKAMDEKPYPTAVHPETVYRLLEENGDSQLLGNIMENRPNTYTFSKALAEVLVNEASKDIPAAIVRPSVILSSLKEPYPGWVESYSGANSLIISSGKGLLRVFNGDQNAVLDCIPVDIVTNLTIAAAWDISLRQKQSIKKIKVFNCTTGLKNPMTVGTFFYKSTAYTKKNSFKDRTFTPTMFVINNRAVFLILYFLLQTLPACILDAVAFLLGREKRMMKVTKKIKALDETLRFFSLNQFAFLDFNMTELYRKMGPIDKELFYLDVKDICWDMYLMDYVAGLKKYILREN